MATEGTQSEYKGLVEEQKLQDGKYTKIVWVALELG